MKTLIKFSWLGFLLLAFIPGFSGLFLIELAVACLLVGGGSCFLVSRGLVPGTRPYQSIQALEEAERNVEMDRISLTRTRLRLRESQQLDQLLALEQGSDQS